MGNDYQLYRFPPLRLAEFSIGRLVAVAMRHGWRPRLGLPTACAMVALAYGAGLVVWQHHPSMAVVTGLVGPSVALVIIAGAGRDLRGRQTPTWAVRLGHWSFAFYLIHWVILVMISGSSGGIGALAVALWISTVVSALLYSCFERPVERWLRLKGWRSSPAPVPAPARA